MINRSLLTDKDNDFVDVQNNKIPTVDSVVYEIIEGNHFYHACSCEIAGSAHHTLVFETGSKECRIVFSIDSTTSGFILNSYEDITESGDGTDLSIINNNRNSANVSTVTLTANPTTLTTTGALLTRTYRSGTAGNVNHRSAGSLTAGNEVIFKPNSKYSLDVENMSTATNYLNISIGWIEQ